MLHSFANDIEGGTCRREISSRIKIHPGTTAIVWIDRPVMGVHVTRSEESSSYIL